MSCSVHPQDELITDEYNTMSFCARETLTLWSRIFRVSTRVRDCVYPSDVVYSPGCMFAVQKPLRGGDAASKCMMLDVVKLAGTIISTIDYSLSNQLIVLPFTVIMTGSVKWTIGLCGVWLMEMVWLWYHLSLYWFVQLLQEWHTWWQTIVYTASFIWNLFISLISQFNACDSFCCPIAN